MAKLGYSYEGVDVKMVSGEEKLAEAMYFLLTQPNYYNEFVYVQEQVNVHLEARCFVVHGKVADILFTRFGRIDCHGYVRDYEKAASAREAMEEWFFKDEVAWQDAMEQVHRTGKGGSLKI